jgi:hypothetical protein
MAQPPQTEAADGGANISQLCVEWKLLYADAIVPAHPQNAAEAPTMENLKPLQLGGRDGPGLCSIQQDRKHLWRAMYHECTFILPASSSSSSLVFSTCFSFLRAFFFLLFFIALEHCLQRDAYICDASPDAAECHFAIEEGGGLGT